MCTVTFVYSAGNTIITSNRDEQESRPSLAPQVYAVNGRNLLFPKDPSAGGTWFASQNANVLVLLNGAFEPHIRKPPYRRSRGLIVLDLLSSRSAIGEWDAIDLDSVEPFTAVLFEDGRLYELRWDAESKFRNDLDAKGRYIWSSATLYPKPVREKRERWFEDFLVENPNPDASALFDFHRHTKNADTENGLVIDRKQIGLKTLSITQAVISNETFEFRHSDLAGNTVSETFCTTV